MGGAKVQILGFGTMGRQIAALFSLLGYEVAIWTQNPADDRLRRLDVEAKLLKRKLSLVADTSPAKIYFVQDLEQLDIALTIECLKEDISVKKDILSKLARICEVGLMMSNSSAITPSELGQPVGVLHFFNPLYAIQLIETDIDSLECHPKVGELLRQLVSLNFTVVTVKHNRGFIANFLLFREISNFFLLIERHKYPYGAVEKVYQALGKNTLLDTIDLVGVDVTLDIIERLRDEDSTVYLPQTLLAAVEKKILGRKNKTSIKELLIHDG